MRITSKKASIYYFTMFLFSHDNEPTKHELMKLAVDMAKASSASNR